MSYWVARETEEPVEAPEGDVPDVLHFFMASLADLDLFGALWFASWARREVIGHLNGGRLSRHYIPALGVSGPTRDQLRRASLTTNATYVDDLVLWPEDKTWRDKNADEILADCNAIVDTITYQRP